MRWRALISGVEVTGFADELQWVLAFFGAAGHTDGKLLVIARHCFSKVLGAPLGAPFFLFFLEANSAPTRRAGEILFVGFSTTPEISAGCFT